MIDRGINDVLSEKRGAILTRWFDAIADSYPANASSFFKDRKDRFANPVGSAIKEATETVVDVLIDGTSMEMPGKNEGEKVYGCLDRVIRIRAVQDFTPSKAVGFIFLLKRVLREELQQELGKDGMYGQLLFLESRIDSMALVCFESYMKYREKLFELKVDEFKHMAFRLLEKANLTVDPTGDRIASGKGAPESSDMK
ncbi:MAG: RsbRD N-terminal domain-containing protein [Deltaproteobacteria bacterium]|nr:RsbRD N-terminal domain-containing protein [Deltaproteobacteria bacterium]MCL5276995.1 RsbRD N-terminal domain-containing protein [Deltaproteobacteria bacterium]